MKQALTRLEQVDLLDSVIESILTQHGVMVDGSTVVFPEGTEREELLPHMPFTERYIITLPDKLILYQMVNRIPDEPVTTLLMKQDMYEHKQQRLLLMRASAETSTFYSPHCQNMI